MLDRGRDLERQGFWEASSEVRSGDLGSCLGIPTIYSEIFARDLFLIPDYTGMFVMMTIFIRMPLFGHRIDKKNSSFINSL